MEKGFEFPIGPGRSVQVDVSDKRQRHRRERGWKGIKAGIEESPGGSRIRRRYSKMKMKIDDLVEGERMSLLGEARADGLSNGSQASQPVASRLQVVKI